ncbi:MAG: hypothetical protein ABI763_05470 [Bacteroidota bacterium]
MKKNFFAFACIICGLKLSAQTYHCESSRIGILITKPLMKNGTIHYNEAITDRKDKRNFSPDFTILNKDSVGNTYVARHHMLDEKRSLDLLFVSMKSGLCRYQVTLLAKDKTPHGIRMDEDGNATDWDENSSLDFVARNEEQKLVDQWLIHFK